MTIILTIHSIVRWVIVLVAIALIARLVIGLIRKMPFDKSARILFASFTGLMDTQMLLGILYLLWNGLGEGIGFPRFRLEHTGMMVVAVIVAHLPAMWKKAPDQKRTVYTLIAVIVSLIIVFIGVARPLGLPRWWNITF
jgi:hypothetical protein